jgi:hypothetical protein
MYPGERGTLLVESVYVVFLAFILFRVECRLHPRYGYCFIYKLLPSKIKVGNRLENPDSKVSSD